jgi:hypothetical protein
MKTKIEVLGYEIEIEETDGVVTVKAEFDGEIVEEFTLEAQDAQDSDDEHEGEDSDDVKGFDDFDGQKEEEDFDGGQDFDDEGESDDDDDDDDDDKEELGNDEVKLESFNAFFKNKK